MIKKISKKIGTWMMFVLSFMVFSQNFIVSEAVKPSGTDYTIFLNGSRFFVHNAKTIDSEVGTEYYLTYTVKTVSKNPAQHGLVGTGDITRDFPYTEGGLMRYAGERQILLDEGSTYFIKYTVAEGGFRYNITRAKGETLEELYVDKLAGDADDEMGYFGIWLAYGGGTDAVLTNVRFYDEKGNDLGVSVKHPSGMGYVMKGDAQLKNATDLDHRYDITVTDKRNIAISNVRIPTTSRIYMEYKVDSAEYLLNQEGVALSNEPENDYPHAKGIIKYVNYPEPTNTIDFLEVGAQYIIMMERAEDEVNVLVQKTKNGQVTTKVLAASSGTYDKELSFISLWFGAGEQTKATFHLTDFKIYDANKNNLGIQCNKAATIVHHGEIEDYTGCEAMYYCKPTGGIMALYKDQTMKLTETMITKNATYKISENVMKAKFADGAETYDYLYKRITDEEANVYERLYHYQVNFVTGTEENIETQKLSKETGYQVMRPTDPVMEGYQFEGWHTREGNTFDFDGIVTESITLYAKWSGDGGVTFLAKDVANDTVDFSPTLIGTGIVLLAVGVAACTVLIRKGVNNEKRKEK